MKLLSRFFLLFLVAALVFPTLPTLAAEREVRAVAPFTEVELAGSVTVVVVQGGAQKVEVEAQAEDLTHLETVVRDAKLRIGRVREANLSSYNFKGPVTVYVTAPTLNALSVSGSGSMKAAGLVQAPALSLMLSGSGRLTVGQVEADKLHLAVSGSGSLDIGKGTAPKLEVTISGSGSVQAPELRAETCQVSLSGSGNCRVSASRSLDASIMGSGGVYVSGNPKISSSVMGSGRVHKS